MEGSKHLIGMNNVVEYLEEKGIEVNEENYLSIAYFGEEEFTEEMREEWREVERELNA